MRLFPLPYSRFFYTKKPLLARLPEHYRNAITTMELRLGPGWSSPPKCQNVHPSLGLADCINLRTLKVFVELDPSDSVFTGFRGKNATEETYNLFCTDLLNGVIQQVPSLETVEIDGFPAVKKDGPLVMGLRRRIEEAQLRLVWGPLRGWMKDKDESGMVGLQADMAGMALKETPRVMEVHA